MDITLVSYGGSGARDPLDEKWRDSQDFLNNSAIRYGEITHTDSWNKTRLSKTSFYTQHKHILDLPRGSGYWLWKPYIILDALNNAKPGDIVVYHDTGRPDNLKTTPYHFTRSIRPAVEFCQKNNGFLPGVYIPHYGPNSQWTKRDCFVQMGCDEQKYWEHGQIQATFSVWQNNPQVIAFVEEWLRWCTDARVLTDQENQLDQPNLEGFTEHRHDQSVLTNLVIKHGIKGVGSPKRTIFRHRNINFMLKQIVVDTAYVERRPNLSEICHQYGSDKLKHGYLRKYQYWMEEQRDDPVHFLELGVFYGASLKMWRDYFPNGQIHGLDWFKGLNGNGHWFPDADKFLREQKISPERISLYQVDQGNRPGMEEFVEQMLQKGRQFDFILDDGSHLMRDQQLAIGLLFPLLKPGGLFIMEDVQSSTHPEYYPDIRKDKSNTTLEVFREFLRSGKFTSMYLTRAEQHYLSDQIQRVLTTWYRGGKSATSVIIKKGTLN